MNQLKICDIHNHILYGVDDGSKTMEQSNRMLAIAYEEGIRAIILTPHYNKRIWEPDMAVWQERYQQLKQVAHENYPDLKIFLGGEIFYNSGTLEDLEAGRVPTMAGGRYILMEFDTNVSRERLTHAVMEIIQNAYIPIVAHVERYECVLKDIDLIYELKELGAYIQVNVSGVMGTHGKLEKKCIKKLLKQGLVDFIATDAHRDDKRAPHIKDCVQHIVKKYGEEYAHRIFYYHPACVITNKDIEE